MNTPFIQTITFLFDNENDQILMQQISGDGPLKRKLSGIKGNVGLTEDINQAAIRNICEVSALRVSMVVLRGILKVIREDTNSSVVYFVYESSKFEGELPDGVPGRLKWIDILNIFNLQLEGTVREIMPYLLDGESFFEGSIYLNASEEVTGSNIRIANTV